MSDLIEREDAIKAIKAEARCAGGAVAEEYADMFIYAILHVNGIDAERKGEWIGDCAFVDEFGQPYVVDRCNQCGYCGYADMNYCPNCGADMRGEDDGR